MDKQYAKRDIMALDKQGGHYWRHANAMTAEGLHSKSDIAAELAYRDARIAELEAHVERLDNELQEKALTDEGVLADAYWNCADKITPWLGEKTGPDTLINSVAQSLEFLIEQWREKKIIEQERDAYRAAEEAQIALRQKMEGERDALAAHVERFGECRLQSGRISLLRVRSLLSDSPTTSLARRDLLKQAEMLEFTAQRLEDNFGANSSMCFIDNTFLRRDARGLRERANRFGTLVKCRSCDGFGFLDNCDGCKACNESGEVVST